MKSQNQGFNGTQGEGLPTQVCASCADSWGVEFPTPAPVLASVRYFASIFG